MVVYPNSFKVGFENSDGGMSNQITLYEIFETPLQVKILEVLLENPNEYFTVSKMARMVRASPAAVARRIRKLVKLNIVKLIEGVGKTKIFKLNDEENVVIALIDFFNNIRGNK